MWPLTWDQGVLARHLLKAWAGVLKPAGLSLPLVPLLLASNPGFSLHDGLGKAHPQQEGGSGVASAQEGGHAARFRDKSEQA